MLSGFPLTQFGLETKEKKDAGFPYTIAPEATRNSSLYYFIKTLYLRHDASTSGSFKLEGFIAKRLSKVPGRDLLPKSDYIRKSYIIEFPALDSANQLGKHAFFTDKNVRFVECHLSLDKFFAPSASSHGQHKFPYGHYTENHVTPDGKRIKLRIDINSKGEVEHLQIKSIQTIEGADGEPRKVVTYYPKELVNQLKPMALKNAEIALKLIKKLNLQKLDKFLSLHKEAHDLDRTLSQLSLRLYKKKERMEYLKWAKIFIDNIANLNALTDSRSADARDAPIKRMCKRINAGEFTPKTFESTQKNVETTGKDEANVEASASLPEEPNLEISLQNPNNAKQKFKLKTNTERSELLAIIKKDKEKLESFPKEDLLSTKELIARTKILDNLRGTLLALYCLPDNPQKELDFIETFEKKLAKTPTLLQNFEAYAKLGKISEVSELYAYVENNLTISFLRELIDNVLFGTTDNLENRIAVCDYLYKNSALYCTVMQVFNSTFELIETGNALSLLGIAFTLNNHLVFDMLLRQGANPNEAGLIRGELIIPMLYLTIASTNEDPYYVKKLLDYGAYVEFPNDYFNYLDVLPCLRPLLKPNAKYTGIIRATLTQINMRPDIDQKSRNESLHLIAKQTSALLVTSILASPRIELINLLAPKSSLYSLLYALAFFSLRKPAIRIRFLATTHEAGLRFYCTQTECDDHTKSEVNNNRNTATSMFFLFNAHTTNNVQLNEMMKIYLQNFNNKHKETLENDPKQLQQLKEILISQATKAEATYYEKKTLYTACSYLHACNSKPTAREKEEMLQVFTHTAKICLNASLNPLILSEEGEWRTAYTRCSWAMAIVDTTHKEHADYLKKTPIFTELEQILDKASQKLTTPLEAVLILPAGPKVQVPTMPTPIVTPPPKSIETKKNKKGR